METLSTYLRVAGAAVVVFPMFVIAVFTLRRASRRVNEILDSELAHHREKVRRKS
jgi:hypothetical protein